MRLFQKTEDSAERENVFRCGFFLRDEYGPLHARSSIQMGQAMATEVLPTTTTFLKMCFKFAQTILAETRLIFG